MAESFQAMVWGDPELGKFRVMLRPYEFRGARTYVAEMNAGRFSDFIASFGADAVEIAKAIAPKKAVILEDVELEDAEDLAEFGFKLEHGPMR